jgi:hypothetical protein
MSPTMESVNSDVLFTLLKGEPGTRKSTAALSYPTPQYWFNIDEKMEALRLPMKNFSIKPTDIEFDNFKDGSLIIKKLEELQVNCKYKTLIVDSITSSGDKINRQTMKMKSGTTNKGGGEKGMRIGGIPVNSIEDYKAEASFFMEMVALLKDISSYHHVNIVLIAHVIGARKDENAPTNSIFSRIIVTGGQIISAKIPAYCTEIYHFNVESNIDTSKEGDYVALTRHSGVDYARTSLPLDPKLLINNKPLYETYIKPAITKLDQQQPLTKF